MDYGSHISLSRQSQPSLLEVTAQDSLNSTLQPAFSHLAEVLSSQFQRARWLGRYKDEVFALLHGLLQHHCLATHDASFSEHFYGLVRVPLPPSPHPSKGASFSSLLSLFSLHRILARWAHDSSSEASQSLPRALHLRSLAVLVLLPYLRGKIARAYEESEEHLPPEDMIGKLRHRLLGLWPFLHLSLGALKFAHYFRYLAGASQVCSLHHRLSGVTLIRCNDEEEETSSKVRVSSHFLDLLMEGLEVGAFFLQFLDWFYSSDRSNILATTSTASSIPPAPHQIMEQTFGSPGDKESCPLCHQKRVQSTAVSTSGVVYCYTCILLHLRQKGVCPVSGYPASPHHLITLYQL